MITASIIRWLATLRLVWYWHPEPHLCGPFFWAERKPVWRLGAGRGGNVKALWCNVIADEHPIPALLAGNEEAWAALASNLHQQWRGLTVRYAGEADADDLLQEVFVRLYTQRMELHDSSHLDQFVRRVWNQRVVDHWRRKAVRQRAADEMRAQEAEPAPETHPDPAGDALRGEFTGIIDRSPLLTAEHKLILKLHLLEGFVLTEVAGLLQQNAATVETWYYRALNLLRLDIALSAYRERRDEFRPHFPEPQRAALDLLVEGLSEKQIARRLGLRVPETRELLAPAVQALCQLALEEWRHFFRAF